MATRCKTPHQLDANLRFLQVKDLIYSLYQRYLKVDANSLQFLGFWLSYIMDQ